MNPLSLPRRRLLGAAAVSAGMTLFPVLPAAAEPSVTRLAFRLPALSGPHPIGTAALHVVDATRTDPWVGPARPRELMIQLWYPTALPVGPPAPWPNLDCALPGAQTTEVYGTLDGRRVAAVARAYVGGCFDLHLRRRDSVLLDGISPRFPEIEIEFVA